MTGHLRSQLIHKFGLHVRVIIGDVQGHDVLPFHGLGKAYTKPVRVRFLHDEDGVRPPDMAFSNRNASAGLRADGPNRQSAQTSKDTLSSQAADSILAANEEDFRLLGFGGLHE